MYFLPRILLIAMVLTVNSKAADEDSLKGLRGVAVVVESIPDVAQRDGLGETLVQTDAELRLRLAGIKVLSKDEFSDASGGPYLYINVNAMPASALDGRYVMNVAVELRQEVKLLRDPTIKTFATTWAVRTIGLIGYIRMIAGSGRDVRDVLKDDIDRFINAYLTVNPRP